MENVSTTKWPSYVKVYPGKTYLSPLEDTDTTSVQEDLESIIQTVESVSDEDRVVEEIVEKAELYDDVDCLQSESSNTLSRRHNIVYLCN